MAPEVISMQDLAFVQLAKSPVVCENLIGIVVNEGHLCHGWKTFQPKYAQIRNLRLHFPAVPILVMLAIMTAYVRNFVAIAVKLHKPARLLRMSIERPNVYLMGHQIRKGIKGFGDLEFVLEGEYIPKTMVFCDDRNEGCEMVIKLRGWLGRSALKDNPDIILEYTTAITIERRDYNLDSFAKGTTRVLVCTEVLQTPRNFPPGCR